MIVEYVKCLGATFQQGLSFDLYVKAMQLETIFLKMLQNQGMPPDKYFILNGLSWHLYCMLCLYVKLIYRCHSLVELMHFEENTRCGFFRTSCSQSKCS